MREVYPIRLIINGRKINQIIIDPHYKERHSESIHDEIIVGLVMRLHNGFFLPVKVDDEGYEYYVEEKIVYQSKKYRLVWLLPKDKSYIGVRNAFRR